MLFTQFWEFEMSDPHIVVENLTMAYGDFIIQRDLKPTWHNSKILTGVVRAGVTSPEIVNMTDQKVALFGLLVLHSQVNGVAWKSNR